MTVIGAFCMNVFKISSNIFHAYNIVCSVLGYYTMSLCDLKSGDLLSQHEKHRVNK